MTSPALDTRLMVKGPEIPAVAAFPMPATENPTIQLPVRLLGKPLDTVRILVSRVQPSPALIWIYLLQLPTEAVDTWAGKATVTSAPAGIVCADVNMNLYPEVADVVGLSC